MRTSCLFLILCVSIPLLAQPPADIYEFELLGDALDVAVVPMQGHSTLPEVCVVTSVQDPSGQDPSDSASGQDPARIRTKYAYLLSLPWDRDHQPGQPPRVTLPPDVLFLAAGRFLGPHSSQIIQLGTRSSSFVFRDDPLPVPTLDLPVASSHQVRFWTVLADLDHDGRDELLLPGLDCFRLYRTSSDGFTPTAVTFAGPGLRPEGDMDRTPDSLLDLSLELPRPVLTDLDGDSRIDCLADVNRTLVLRPGVAGPEFFGPAQSLLPLPAPLTFTGPGRYQTRVAFLTSLGPRPGKPALVTLENTGRLGLVSAGHSRVEVRRLFDQTDSAKPFSLLLSGYALGLQLPDINADGLPDIVVWTVDFALMAQVVTGRKTGTIDYRVFLGRPDGSFRSRPDLVFPLEVPLADLEHSPRIPYASFAGDFNGDGLNDVLHVDYQRGLIVRRLLTSPDGGPLFLEDEPLVNLRFRPTAVLRVEDLNHDRRADLVVSHRLPDTHDDRLVLFLSRKPTP